MKVSECLIWYFSNGRLPAQPFLCSSFPLVLRGWKLITLKLLSDLLSHLHFNGALSNISHLYSAKFSFFAELACLRYSEGYQWQFHSWIKIMTSTIMTSTIMTIGGVCFYVRCFLPNLVKRGCNPLPSDEWDSVETIARFRIMICLQTDALYAVDFAKKAGTSMMKFKLATSCSIIFLTSFTPGLH